MPRFSTKQRKMRGSKSGKRQFVMIYRNVKRSAAYHGLSLAAGCLLFELIDRFTGCKNGMIRLGIREAKYELGCGQGQISNATRELDDAGLARPMEIGAWRGRRATEWRLMWLPCNKTGDLPVSQWEQRKPFSEFLSNDKPEPMSGAERVRRYRERQHNAAEFISRYA